MEAFSDAEDPIALLVASAREHIPLNTSVGCTTELSHVPDPENRQPINQVIEGIHEQKWYLNQIRYRRAFEAKAGSLGRCTQYILYNSILAVAGIPDPPLFDSIMAALRDARRITTLYSHQTSAIAALSQGKDVIVSTSTASGKSVIYQARSILVLSRLSSSAPCFQIRSRCCECSSKTKTQKRFSSTPPKLVSSSSMIAT
jgi:DEAD/DEAH box helicase domain-containing protein